MNGVLRNIGVLAACRDEGGQAEVHETPSAAVAWRDGRIAWCGAERDLPPEFSGLPSYDAGGRLAVPGLIDCHTHLAFAGWREDEFEARILGKSYLEIARDGGGIRRTVRMTRAAPEDELHERATGMLRNMSRLGVTTVECKSGYGLSVEAEMKQLDVYRRLAETQPLTIVPTFLGAHTTPIEFENDRPGYLSLVISEMLPEIARRKLARYCDIFVEESAFTPEEAHVLLARAREHGLGAKLHVDQFTNKHGGILARDTGAVSADHLECTDDPSIDAIAEAGVIAVALPIASLYTRHVPMNARRFIDRGAAVAVATDFNPGSAPSYDISLAMMLACTMCGMTPREALKGASVNAAKAIGMESEIGSIETGKRADIAVIDATGVTSWLYHYRPCEAYMTVKNGSVIHRSAR